MLLLCREDVAGTAEPEFNIPPRPQPTSLYAAQTGADVKAISTGAEDVVSVHRLPLAGVERPLKERYPVGYLVEVVHEGRLATGEYLGSTKYRIEVE